jgi:hypothetical protein
MDAQTGAALQAVVGQETPREVGNPVGPLRLDFQRVAGTGRDEKRRGRGSRADAAEPTPARAAKIKNAEMKASRRLDEDCLCVALRRHA